MAELTRAPWTEGQVAVLNAFQAEGRFHPFTCGSDDHVGPHPRLVATEAGWVCPDPACGYTQDWAHAFMVWHSRCYGDTTYEPWET